MDMPDRATKRLDDAARAAWLYYIAGKTQDEVAGILGVSRQSAQRMVSLAMSSGLVKVRIDHPIGQCMSLAAALSERFGLSLCEVVPSLPGSDASLPVAHATADVIERWLLRPEAGVMGLGTGRTLRAAIEALPRIDCPQHRIVSLTGNIAPDGSTAFYNVLFSISDKVTAPTYPLPMPVIATSAAERDMLLTQKTIAAARDLAARADLAVVGVGQMDAAAPLLLDGFITRAELDELRAAGAVGEILGWAFDASGKVIPGLMNDRVSAADLWAGGAEGRQILGVAGGAGKLPAIRGALEGGLLNGLVTDEETATALLA